MPWLQKVSLRKSEEHSDYLIFVEHPAVYTYGRKDREFAERAHPKGHFIERGGGVTYHNPGQLVCYPILSLLQNEQDLHGYLRSLESVIIDVLCDFGLEGERRPSATGVWLRSKDKKIASIGVAVSNWITFHGCALNVDNDLEGFQIINPCGFPPEVMTSMREHIGEGCPSMDQVKESFLTKFLRRFRRALLV